MAAKRPTAPKACNLMTDVAGDGDWNNASMLVKSKNLDIVSGDVATTAKDFYAVLRLSDFTFANDNWATLGYRWMFGSVGGGARYDFEYRRGGTGTINSSATIGGQAVPYSVKVIGNAIVWKVPRAGIAALARPNLVWSGFGGNSQVLSSTADDASDSGKKYKDRQPSCIPMF
jgi:hypothetical protein